MSVVIKSCIFAVLQKMAKQRILNFYINRRCSFEHIKSGSVNTFIHNNRVVRSVMNRYDRDIMLACRYVRSDMKKYLAYNEMPDILPSATTFYRHSDYRRYINTEVDAIDINACYWNILYNKGILSEKVYKRFVDQKKARLIAVGNLFKKTIIKKYIEGVLIDTKILDNDFAIGWQFVVSESWKILLECREVTNDNVLMFKTDCFFVLPEYTKCVCDLIEAKGLSWKIEKKVLK